MTSQPAKRYHAVFGSCTMSVTHEAIESSGTSGTAGQRNGRAPIGIDVAQRDHARRDEHEREQRADVAEVDGVVDVDEHRRHADERRRS